MNPETALHSAVTAALRAPSVLNTQPWTWRVNGDTAELWAARFRQLPTIDPDGRLLTLSCGITLHHALTALAATGHDSETHRFPDPTRPDLLAAIRPTREQMPSAAAIRHYQSTLIRHTDRRPFPDLPVPEDALAALRTAAEDAGAHLHLLPIDQVSALAAAVNLADATEIADPAYRAELAAWVHHTPDSPDGIADATTFAATPRSVPIREFDLIRPVTTAVADTDRAARYALVFTDADSPVDWLAAGEAVGAVLLAAVEADLAVSAT